MGTTSLIIKLEKEAKKIQKKIRKLSNFSESAKYNSINKTHKSLLYSQYMAMRIYHSCLENRIELLKKDI